MTINETDFKNIIYRGMIGELDRREDCGLYKGNAHHLAGHLSDEIWAAYQMSAAYKREQTQHEAAIKTINHLRRDIDDLNSLMQGIDAHIHWLGAGLRGESVEIPEYEGVLNTLQRMKEKLIAAAGAETI